MNQDKLNADADRDRLNGAGPGAVPPDGAGLGPRNKWASRAVVLFLFLGPLSFGVAGLVMSLRPPPPSSQAVISPFKPLEGSWEGDYVISKGGQVVSSVPMKLNFRHVLANKDFRQEGHFTYKDSKTGEERIQRELNKSDFKLKEMTRRVVRDNGNDVRLLAGAVEDGKFAWRRSGPNYSEEFTEWVEGDVYHIRGKAVYGDPAAEPEIHEADFKRAPQP